MQTKTKKRLLDIAGAVISFAAPAVAAVYEFPRAKAAVSSGNSVSDFLNISTAALAIIVVLLAITCWRFLKSRIKMPDSGLLPSIVLFAVLHGIELIVHSFVIISFWAVIGTAVAAVLWKISDSMEV